MRRFSWQELGSISKTKRDKTSASIVPPILTILIIIAIIYTLFLSPAFTITNITVSGNEFVDSNLVKTAIETQFQKKRFWFLNQSNILAFNDAEVSKLIQHPRIANVEISKQMPHTIMVTINEKDATAIWNQQGRWFELDQDGQIISETGGPEMDSIVLLDSNRVDPSNPGVVVVNRETIEFVTVISANIPRGLGFEIIKYDVADWKNYSVTAITSDGWGLRFSNQLPISDQVSKLKTFFISKNQSEENWKANLRYIDLRFGSSRIYYQ